MLSYVKPSSLLVIVVMRLHNKSLLALEANLRLTHHDATKAHLEHQKLPPLFVLSGHHKHHDSSEAQTYTRNPTLEVI
jgi:hypothetical protein